MGGRNSIHAPLKPGLAQELGRPAAVLAWPYGRYDRTSIEIANQWGFRFLLTANRGYLGKDGDRSAIPPFAVTLGPHVVLRARRMEVIFFAGRFQRFALREVLFRRPTLHFPGTLLKLRKESDGRLVPQDLRVWATPEEAGIVTAQTI